MWKKHIYILMYVTLKYFQFRLTLHVRYLSLRSNKSIFILKVIIEFIHNERNMISFLRVSFLGTYLLFTAILSFLVLEMRQISYISFPYSSLSRTSISRENELSRLENTIIILQFSRSRNRIYLCHRCRYVVRVYLCNKLKYFCSKFCDKNHVNSHPARRIAGKLLKIYRSSKFCVK